MGNAHLEELLEKATRLGEKETASTQQVITGVVDEDAGMGQAVDGAAGGGDDPDVAKDPKKHCWNCQTPGHAVELLKCSGCKRVSAMNLYCLSPENWLFDGIFGGHKDGLPHTLVPLLAH